MIIVFRPSFLSSMAVPTRLPHRQNISTTICWAVVLFQRALSSSASITGLAFSVGLFTSRIGENSWQYLFRFCYNGQQRIAGYFYGQCYSLFFLLNFINFQRKLRHS
jgi:hypothetical protein